MLEKLFATANGFNRRFAANGNDPFKIMTRLLEESGELAQQVNHFEGMGVKNKKMGAPNREQLAKEVSQVMGAAAQIGLYYGVEQEVEAALELAYQRLKSEGWIEE